ncbi:MAG: PEP-utilizing enzyme [Deltaproteobacteria bacterium]|nr:PEP-utilizing enzyme [Deltaproteobacteria bacterium]
MSWFRNIFHKSPENSGKLLSDIQEKFSIFLDILDKNNHILKIIGDLEEKSQGEYLFDINYIRTNMEDIETGVNNIIDELISIGGDGYSPLKNRFSAINADINCTISGNKVIVKDDFIVPIKKLGRECIYSAGSKNAQLGEIQSKLGIPVPGGFAITAWAYKHFVDANNLQERIDKSIHQLDIKNYNDLVSTSNQIQSIIKSSPVPGDLIMAIMDGYSELKKHSQAKGFAMRSSAIGEDTLLSFAGQYATFLNVQEDELIDKYREVLASKFTPKAIYYFLSHSLSETELAMSVGCMEMVNSAISGVIYTLDPVRPEEQCMSINSIYGLGKYLVDGTLTPDIFKISRKDGSVKETHIVQKPIKLIMDDVRGTKQEPVQTLKRGLPSLDEKTVRLLYDAGSKIEGHYRCPQDIEWAIDQNNRLFVLQTRPLRIIKTKPSGLPNTSPNTSIVTSNLNVLLAGGTTVCPGAGAGLVYHANAPHQLASVPDGAVLITRTPFPGIIMVMNKVHAIVTEQGGTASHMATVARECRIPTICGIHGTAAIPDGQAVTVDASGAVIYTGIHEQLIKARQPDYESMDQAAIFELLKMVLTKVSPLNLVDSTAPDFKADNCRTFHDITRFVHQKAMEEMFNLSSDIGCKEDIGLRLKSKIPMSINLIYIDRDISDLMKNKWVNDTDMDSVPMFAFWSGIKKEGWPSTPPIDISGLISVMSTQMSQARQNSFLEKSFAILSKEYMLLGLHMGYHFSTVESLCSNEPDKNYIRIQYKDGGAALDRRIRRIKLLAEILEVMGFSNFSEADFLDSVIHYHDRDIIAEKLHLVGRLTMMFKQLDMALSTDSITNWYRNDFMGKLGLKKDKAGADV